MWSARQQPKQGCLAGRSWGRRSREDVSGIPRIVGQRSVFAPRILPPIEQALLLSMNCRRRRIFKGVYSLLLGGAV
jgi:hypothetical protein